VKNRRVFEDIDIINTDFFHSASPVAQCPLLAEAVEKLGDK
jgi:hypothetical protein